jgi:hypothetical protein
MQKKKKKYVNAFCGQNEELLNVKPGGIQSSGHALKDSFNESVVIIGSHDADFLTLRSLFLPIPLRCQYSAYIFHALQFISIAFNTTIFSSFVIGYCLFCWHVKKMNVISSL